MIGAIFNEIVFRPIFNSLIFLSSIIPGADFGVAVIILTLAIRFLLYPLSKKAIRAQTELAKVQPKIKEIQKKFKDDRQKQAEALMSIYKEHKINPLAGFLPLLIQLPIIIALYWAIRQGLNGDNGVMDKLYSFVSAPENLRTSFLGLLDLKAPSAVLALLAAGAQFMHSRLISKTAPTDHKNKDKASKSQQPDFAKMMTTQMMYVFPVITLVISYQLGAGIALYWFVSTSFSVVETYLVKVRGQKKKIKPNHE